jgi:hypothetical protein
MGHHQSNITMIGNIKTVQQYSWLDSRVTMKKIKKSKNTGLSEKEIEVGYLYFTTANQYRAVLAMKGEFLIYAPSSEGMEPLGPNDTTLPFENSPWKKCAIVTFAKKDYQVFEFNGTEAIKHQLNDPQIAEAIAQCNAKAAMTELLAE